jgi:hypothetical protein
MRYCRPVGGLVNQILQENTICTLPIVHNVDNITSTTTRAQLNGTDERNFKFSPS